MEEQFLNNKNVAGGTGLTVGGKVTIGDVTGQLAIGEYISQFMIKEPSGDALVRLIAYLEQKRQEAANLEILRSYGPSSLPYFDPRVKELVTTNRVEELNKALMYLQDHRILLFTGIGGVGKTTLARAIIDIRPANIPIPFWFDFRLNQNAKLGDILEKLAAYMNSPDIAHFKEEKRKPEKKDIDKLTDKLQAGNPVWLIFDNLETILDDVYFQDENVDLFFTCLRKSTHEARIIITSRTFPKLKDGECLVDVIEGEKQDIKGLKTNFAVDYLKNGLGDLDPDKLQELATGVDGHPLALQLLISLVKKFGVSDTLKDLTRYKTHKEGTIKKASQLFDKLAGDEKELLQRISVYRKAETMNAIENMFTAKTPIDAVDNLIDESLLETDHKGNYWLHPLVQEFAYDDLKNKEEVHKLAMDYYYSLPIPKKPTKKEDIQSLIEAYHHACMAEEYDQAFDIIFYNNLAEYLDLWGNYTVLIDLYLKILPKDNVTKIILKDAGSQGFILGNLGLAYYYLGEFRKAFECFEQALKISRELGDRLREGIWLGSLGNVYNYLGDQKKAIEYDEQALKIATEIRDRRGEGIWLGSLGNAYNYLGDQKKAVEYYEQALKIAKERKDRRREGIWLGSLGNAYNYLDNQKKAIEYDEQALKISRELGDRRSEGIWLGYIGDAYNNLRNHKKAIEYYEQGLKIAKELGDRQNEGIWLGYLGKTYNYLGESRKAIEYLKHAQKISKEMGDRLREGTWFEWIGKAHRDLGEILEETDWYPLLRRIKDGKCTPFLGVGVSAGKIPLGFEIVSEWAKKYDYPMEDSYDLIRVAQFVALIEDAMTPKEEMCKKIKEQLKEVTPKYFETPDEPHGLLADLPLPVYITTNYNDLMVRALKSRGKTPYQDICRWNKYLKRFKLTSSDFILPPLGFVPTPEKPLVFYLHGFYKIPESLVLTEDDYLDFLVAISREQNLLPQCIQEALIDTSLLFLGYRIADWDFHVLFRILAEYLEISSRKKHYSVQPVPRDLPETQKEKTQKYLDRYFEELDIKVYWQDCREFSKELRTRWAAEEQAEKKRVEKEAFNEGT